MQTQHPSYPGAWPTYKGHVLKEYWHSLPQKPSAVNSSSSKGGSFWCSPDPVHAGMSIGLILCRSCSSEYLCPAPFMLGCWLSWSCAGLMQAITYAVSSWMQWLCHIQNTVSLQSTLIWLSQSLRPFSAMFPMTWEGPCYRCHIFG